MAPAADEFEITVFGSGRGESSVVHVGDGNWCVIDSCLNRDTRAPAAVTYLEGLGVNLATQVKLVVATHWHQDHIKGLASLFRAARSADFALPCALSKQLAVELFSAAQASPGSSKTGVHELAEVFEEIARRKAAETPCEMSYVSVDKKIPIRDVPHEKAHVVGLSPADDVTHSYGQRLKKNVIDGHLTYVQLPESNDISVATWLQISGSAFLFGADLENPNSDSEGWRHVVKRFQGRLQGADFYKIPHHGSGGAHNDDIWKHFLVPKPFAAVTAFDGGGSPPPQSTDLLRLRKLAGKLFYTGRRALALKPSLATKQAALSGIAQCPRKYYAIGRVTLRRKNTAAKNGWTATTDGSASLLA